MYWFENLDEKQIKKYFKLKDPESISPARKL